MIKTAAGNTHIAVTGTGYSYPYVTGIVRYNNLNSSFEVMHGDIWHQVPNEHLCISLTNDASLAIEWAKRKMVEEVELIELCKKHPGLAELKEKYEMYKILVTEESKENKD